jgi:hypothetical protein
VRHCANIILIRAVPPALRLASSAAVAYPTSSLGPTQRASERAETDAGPCCVTMWRRTTPGSEDHALLAAAHVPCASSIYRERRHVLATLMMTTSLAKDLPRRLDAVRKQHARKVLCIPTHPLATASRASAPTWNSCRSAIEQDRYLNGNDQTVGKHIPSTHATTPSILLRRPTWAAACHPVRFARSSRRLQKGCLYVQGVPCDGSLATPCILWRSWRV